MSALDSVSAATVVPAQTTRPTHVRYVMLSFILLATIVSYVDRTNLGIAAPFMSKELGLDKAHMGQLFAAFGLTYAFALIPGGYIADLFGSRLSYAVALVGWSLATMSQGLASSFNTIFGARLSIGVLEAPAFPANARAVTMWFPVNERGFATSVYIMGQYIGTPIFAGLLLLVAQDLGWRYIFLLTGGFGVLLGLCWYAIYQDPLKSRFVNKAELDHIEAGGGLVAGKKPKFDWKTVFRLLQHRQILAICLGKFCSNSVLVFFTTWFLTYLVEERHMGIIKVGFFQALPFIGATIGILSAGFFSDVFIRRGVSMSTARKTPLIIGSLLASVIVLVNFVDSDVAIIGILTTAFFAQGVASSSWAAVSEVAPRQYIGLTSGVTSLAANLAGISTPLVIGYVLQATGSFYWALNFIGFVCLIGTCSYSFLLGTLHRIEMDD